MAAQIRFFPLDPESGRYPRPKIPVLPVLSSGTFREKTIFRYPSRFFSADCLSFRSGRAAIAQALRLAGVGRGDEVLVPAYHCGSMVEPAIWLGAGIVFVHVNPDLTLNLEDLVAKITPHTRLVIAPHYFGFPQPLDRMLALKDRCGFVLLEDCAHALYGADGSHVLGSRGDYAIASTCKWFPAPEGGMLCANPPADLDDKVVRTRGSLGLEARSMLSIVHDATIYGRMPLLRPLARAANWMSASTKPLRDSVIDGPMAASAQWRWLRPEQVDDRQSRSVVWLLRHAARHTAAERRRANFLTLLDHLGGLRRARPLHMSLPTGTVPYMFPLVLDDPHADFATLKRRGVPIWRWEDLAESDCPIALDYRLRLLQLPCHQELTAHEMDWMIEQLREVLA